MLVVIPNDHNPSVCLSRSCTASYFLLKIKRKKKNKKNYLCILYWCEMSRKIIYGNLASPDFRNLLNERVISKLYLFLKTKQAVNSAFVNLWGEVFRSSFTFHPEKEENIEPLILFATMCGVPRFKCACV